MDLGGHVERFALYRGLWKLEVTEAGSDEICVEG